MDSVETAWAKLDRLTPGQRSVFETLDRLRGGIYGPIDTRPAMVRTFARLAAASQPVKIMTELRP